MRLELLLAMGSTSLALSATVASIFGMNLLSGLEASPHLFWGVSAGGAPMPTPMPRPPTLDPSRRASQIRALPLPTPEYLSRVAFLLSHAPPH